MNNKIILSLMFGIMLLSICSAACEPYGNYKQNEPVELIQTCTACSSINASIVYPDSTNEFVVYQNIAGIYNYTFSNTAQLGTYKVIGTDAWCYTFTISPTGVEQKSILENPVLLILIIISLILLVLGFYTKNPPLVFISGILITISGIYTMIYGFNNYTDMYTRAAAIVIIALGSVFTVASAYEWMAEVSGEEDNEVRQDAESEGD
jgi:hypothetical protein